MKKIHFIVFFVLALGIFFISLPVQAQYQNLTKKDSINTQQHTGQVERVNPAKKSSKKGGGFFFGGGIGGGYSTYNSYIQLTPIIGYRITPKVQVGSRITFMYQWSKDGRGNKYNSSIYGGSLFLRYAFLKWLYAQTEYEILSVPDYYSSDANAKRTVDSFFAGLGYIQHVGGSAFMTISVLYNFLDNQYSPYSNPLIRVGFGVGL